MFTFEQQIKAGLICSVLYPKIIKETFEVPKRSQLLYDIWNSYGKVQSVFQMVWIQVCRLKELLDDCEYLLDWLGPN